MSSALRVFLLLYFRTLSEYLREHSGEPDGGDHLAAALTRFQTEERAAGKP